MLGCDCRGTSRFGRAAGSWLIVAAAVLAVPAIGAESPDASAQRDEIRRLIRQLGDKDYFARQQAEERLAGFRFDAFDALSEAATNEDLEIAARAKRLLQLMKVQWADKDDPAEVKQILRDYEFQNAESRQSKMNTLAGLADDAGAAALCRLVRYEKSALLSKQAAIKLLTKPKGATPPPKELADVLTKNLGDSRRAAAEWLRTWIRAAEEPRVMVEPWSRFVEAEETALRNSSGQTQPELIAALLRLQFAWLRKLGRTEEAVAAMSRLVQLEKGDPDTLAGVLEWLVDQKDWKTLDRLAEQFSTQIAAQPALLYTLAEAQAARGNTSQAEQTADRAFKLFSGRQPQDLIRHMISATNLQQRGRFAWAKREFRYVAGSGTPTSDMTIRSLLQLSEMLHDQAEEQEAGDVLREVVQAVGANRPAEARVIGRHLGELRSRMHYFYACHGEGRGDRAKQREHLDQALVEDPADIDVLIACYRLPDTTPDYRNKVKKSIEKVAEDLRAKISDEPDNPSNYNQFAWLVGNTEGNLDEALQYSKKSVELSPDAGGYFDTLGRVYFAKGDYDSAVQNQTKAAELDPHSGQILRQLDLFRKKLAEKNRKP